MKQNTQIETQEDESLKISMTPSEKMFKEKIESTFGEMTKEEIIASLVSHVASRTRSINEWERKAMESKGKDKKEWQSGADTMRMERQMITRLHINLDQVRK